jgi:hypothetical protein
MAKAIVDKYEEKDLERRNAKEMAAKELARKADAKGMNRGLLHLCVEYGRTYTNLEEVITYGRTYIP